MKYSIALRNLPFEPETRQVIYVENQYDERVNAIIKEKYDWLRWTFKRANLDFVYLPMFFNDEEIKEKVLYYAPYLTEEIMEKSGCAWPGLKYEGEEIENIKKRPLFIYTDGLNEAENRQQEQFGDDRLLDILRHTHFETAQQVIDTLKAVVEQHRNGAEPNDDLTMMCVRVK